MECLVKTSWKSETELVDMYINNIKKDDMEEEIDRQI